MVNEPQDCVPPVVAIVGRPNVGKSALLNCLARERIAIVDPTSGVTRDRVTTLIEHDGRLVDIWDTGGVGSTDDLAVEVEAQIDVAIRRADLILMVVDVLDGLQPMDVRVADRLRRLGRPLLLVVNKVDDARHEQNIADFYRLGIGDPVLVSALNGLGRAELLEQIMARTPASAAHTRSPELRIAAVGRQNVGKSTLINTLANEERVIVSEMPGTTRDSVDVRIELDGHVYVAIDTAGVKRRTRMKDSIEFYSFTRTDAAIRRADVVLLMFDVTQEITRMDMRIARRIEELGKACALVVNKWDLSTGFEPDAYTRYLNDNLPMLDYAPISFISARDGTHVRETVSLCGELHRQACTEVSTSHLNEILSAAQQLKRPRVRKNQAPKILYGTQAGTCPPTFLLFASHVELIGTQYTRFLANFLRRRLECEEVPLRILYRSRHRQDQSKDAETESRRRKRRPSPPHGRRRRQT